MNSFQLHMLSIQVAIFEFQNWGELVLGHMSKETSIKVPKLSDAHVQNLVQNMEMKHAFECFL